MLEYEHSHLQYSIVCNTIALRIAKRRVLCARSVSAREVQPTVSSFIIPGWVKKNTKMNLVWIFLCIDDNTVKESLKVSVILHIEALKNWFILTLRHHCTIRPTQKSLIINQDENQIHTVYKRKNRHWNEDTTSWKKKVKLRVFSSSRAGNAKVLTR